ncbi:protein TonB [Sphingobium wenxiniae]|uniref:Energy transducer TonB n=2 Tax=Sphingobium TaxID=165695 RepID=T0HR23_9SPHN|nr:MULTISPECIES: TonB family protein [Sphingobium]EQB01745.1 energy transducer TonB [Sphingobium baderi LL03]KMS62357.1 energy transducer TonB [Sphingobium baderi LL03]MBB6191670.1 protein TonB [Sphingobium wenxiniae]TWH92731.1 outer membrane transport energization protein TonB [Sphingobium wenxiniae]WRD76493.1 energy transducer TonB [Sphingobium baderi]
MAYADHSQGSSRTISIIIVALIHAVLGYAFVTGLGMKYVKKAAEQLNVIDVKEEPPPPDEEPPPPPPEQPVEPPPVVAPPPIVQTPAPAPPIQTVRTPPPVFNPVPVAAPPPPPPPPAVAATRATPRSAPGSWLSDADYPSRAQREERSGTAGFRLEIGPDGRVTSCTITSSTGHSDLDEATCRLLPKRARFKPAKGSNGEEMADTYNGRITWRLPE